MFDHGSSGLKQLPLKQWASAVSSFCGSITESLSLVSSSGQSKQELLLLLLLKRPIPT